MITQEQITEAEAEVEKAEEQLDLAEEAHEQIGTKQIGIELQMARATSHTARDRLRRLRTQFAAEQAARRARAAAEAEFAAEVPAVAAALDGARGEAVEALRAAETAVGRLLEACGEYDAAVRGVAADLRARGLMADEGESLGGARTGLVRLNDGTWIPLDGPSVLAELLSRLMKARDPRHPLAMLTAATYGGMAAAAGRDALLKAAKAGAR